MSVMIATQRASATARSKDQSIHLAKRHTISPALEAVVKELSQGNGMGPWVHPIRVAVSGRGEGIGLFEMLQLLGRETTLARLRKAAETLAME